MIERWKKLNAKSFSYSVNVECLLSVWKQPLLAKKKIKDVQSGYIMRLVPLDGGFGWDITKGNTHVHSANVNIKERNVSYFCECNANPTKQLSSFSFCSGNEIIKCCYLPLFLLLLTSEY